MAENQKLSIHAQIAVELVVGAGPQPVDIIATSAEELLDTVAWLTGQTRQPQQTAQGTPSPAATQAQVAPGPTAQPQASTATAGPVATTTPLTPAPAQAQAAPVASTPAATAPWAAAPPTAATTGITLNDVLGPARQLLQLQGGEETLRQILANNGAEAISTASPETYPAIKAAIEQSLGGQA